MRFRASRCFAHVLLAVMLATFLSPSFGWHMHAEHHEIVADAGAPSPYEDDGDHHPGADGQGDAHTSIGHVLGHLAMHVPQHNVAAGGMVGVAPACEVPPALIASEVSPPYRPPLPARLA